MRIILKIYKKLKKDFKKMNKEYIIEKLAGISAKSFAQAVDNRFNLLQSLNKASVKFPEIHYPGGMYDKLTERTVRQMQSIPEMARQKIYQRLGLRPLFNSMPKEMGNATRAEALVPIETGKFKNDFHELYTKIKLLRELNKLEYKLKHRLDKEI